MTSCCARGLFRIFGTIGLFIAALTIHPDTASAQQGWVASWATSPATFFQYTPPVAPAPPGPGGWLRRFW